MDAHTETEAIRRGEAAAFEAVFRQYYAPLCHYAVRLLNGEPDEAEDLVQQSFVRLWEKRSSIDVNGSVKSYLYKMVYNAVLNRIRNQKNQSKHHTIMAFELERVQNQTPELVPELREKLQKALQDLPPQCRHIFELSRFEELKYREIADLLQISIKTVETQMGKALRLMRLQMADYLISIIGMIYSFSIFWNL